MYKRDHKPQVATMGGAGAGGNAITPISELNPYVSRWRIMARVVSRGDVRTFNTNGREGKFFNCEIVDAHGTAIRCTFFGAAADAFDGTLRAGSVYTFAGGRKGNNRRNGEPELTFDERSEITEVLDDAATAGIKSAHYGHPVPIADILSKAKDSECDVMGVVVAAKPLQQFTSKAGNAMVKRDISIADPSGAAVELTLWGDQNCSLNVDGFPLVSARACRVGEYMGRKTLSVGFGSQIALEPQCAEADAVRAWWANGGSDMAGQLAGMAAAAGGGAGGGGRGTVSCTEPAGCLADIKDDDLIAMYGSGADAAQQSTLVARGWVASLRPPHVMGGASNSGQASDRVPWYMACPTCNKKVQDDGQCYKCNTAVVPVPRYILSFQFADTTGSRYVTAFNEEAEVIMGISAQELKALWEQDRDGAYTRVFAARNKRPCVVRLRAKVEESQGGQMDAGPSVRVQVTGIAREPAGVDWGALSMQMIADISRY